MTRFSDDMSPRVTRWWIKHGVSLAKTDKNWIAHAAYHGNTILLDYLLRNGFGSTDRCEFVNVVTRFACKYGHANVLEWLANRADLPFEFGVDQVMMALKSDAILDVHWHIIAWWARRVKAGDRRCKVDMDELKTAVLEWEASIEDDGNSVLLMDAIGQSC